MRKEGEANYRQAQPLKKKKWWYVRRLFERSSLKEEAM
jgi:hypothetical protein